MEVEGARAPVPPSWRRHCCPLILLCVPVYRQFTYFCVNGCIRVGFTDSRVLSTRTVSVIGGESSWVHCSTVIILAITLWGRTCAVLSRIVYFTSQMILDLLAPTESRLSSWFISVFICYYRVHFAVCCRYVLLMLLKFLITVLVCEFIIFLTGRKPLPQVTSVLRNTLPFFVWFCKEK